jgi:hypothetical protein
MAQEPVNSDQSHQSAKTTSPALLLGGRRRASTVPVSGGISLSARSEALLRERRISRDKSTLSETDCSEETRRAGIAPNCDCHGTSCFQIEPVRLHPNLAELSRQNVANLHLCAAMTHAARRDWGVRFLIDYVAPQPMRNGALHIELGGAIANMTP